MINCGNEKRKHKIFSFILFSFTVLSVSGFFLLLISQPRIEKNVDYGHSSTSYVITDGFRSELATKRRYLTHINVYLSAFSHHFASPLRFSARPSVQPTDPPLLLPSPSHPCPRLFWRLPRRIFSSFETAYTLVHAPGNPTLPLRQSPSLFGRIVDAQKVTHTIHIHVRTYEESRTRVLRADRRVHTLVRSFMRLFLFVSCKSVLDALNI